MTRPSSQEDRTVVEANGDAIGVQIARVFLSIVGEDVNPDIAKELTMRWIDAAHGSCEATFIMEDEE